MLKEKFLQFGTGNFLRGFTDPFIDALNKKGLFDSKIVVVSPTDSKNVDTINSQHGRYNLIIRGIENGNSVCKIKQIESISRAINPYRDFDAFLTLAAEPALKFIVSNTTESGIVFDDACSFNDRPASSFPAKLTQFLYARFRNGLNGFIILACELIDKNGEILKEDVLRYAQKWRLGKDFIDWLTAENKFCSTLVDRIVTGFPKEEANRIFRELGYSDRLLNTAEPYHLWVIEDDLEDVLPLKKAGFNVIWTKDISPYKKRKVRVLNGAHTSLVFPSLLCGVQTVGESLKDGLLSKYLDTCLFKYILPALGNSADSVDFANSVLERFANPYIKHMWKSISLNSVSKFKARVLPSIEDYLKYEGEMPLPLVFSLACLIEYYKKYEVSDDEKITHFIKNNEIPAILENKDLWGADLSFLTEHTVQYIHDIHRLGIRGALTEIL